MAGAAFIASGATAAALSRLPLPWRRRRSYTWILATLLVFALAHIGHSAPGSTTAHAGTQVAVSIAALFVAAAMAIVGAYLTRRRPPFATNRQHRTLAAPNGAIFEKVSKIFLILLEPLTPPQRLRVRPGCDRLRPH